MKKALMILASVALGASMATASTTNVESRNVVGMVDQALATPGYSMIGQNWQKPDGSALTFNDIFDPADLYPGADIFDFETCDQVFYWDTTLNGGNGDFAQFFYFDQDGSGAQWTDAGFTPSNQPIQPGVAFWFYRPSANGSTTISLKGQVASNATINFTAPVGYSLFSSAYPVEPIVGDGITGYPGADIFDFEGCDQIFIWDSALNGGQGDYAQYLYFDQGSGAEWCDAGFTPVTVAPNKILYGQGGWYFNQGASTLNWSQSSPL